MTDIVEIDDELNNEFDDYSESNSTDELEPVEPVDDQQDTESDGKQPEEEKEDFGRKVQKRIDKLVYERNIEREERQREIEENRKLREKLEQLESRFNQNEQERTSNDYASKIAQLKARKVELYDSGEYQQAADLDDEIIELKLKQRESKAEPERKPEVQERPIERQEPVQQIPQAQESWLENNDWYFNPKKAQQAQVANNVYLTLVNEGYDPNDEDTYKELDKRLGKGRQAPPPTSAPDRGSVASSSKSVKFTNEDAAKLRDWGLDPNDVKVRKEYLKNKRVG